MPILPALGPRPTRAPGAAEQREGEVFGYLGPNGAGKTTTIRTLLDFIRATSGSASVFGLDSRRHSREIRRRVGYLPGDIAIYDKLTGSEVLRYLANLRGGVDWGYVDELADRLDCDLSQPVRSLSRGNKQKIGLVQAFTNRPDLIIMDEASSGLDPLMQQEFYRLVEEVKADGRTVFISSHILPEVERVCDRVGIIRGGELITVEDVSGLKERVASTGVSLRGTRAAGGVFQAARRARRDGGRRRPPLHGHG